MTPADPHRGQEVVAAGPPVEAGAGVVVLVHGRNAGPHNILELAARLDRPALTWLAPAAADRTWYPHSFLAPRADNEPWLTSALGALRAIVDDVTARGVSPRRIVLAGFSQGACLASEFVLRQPGRCGGLIAFSGGLIGPPETAWPDPAPQPGLRAFFGCSDLDSHVPWTRVAASAATFSRAGATVDLRQYPGMGHLVNADEIVAARAVVDAAVGVR